MRLRAFLGLALAALLAAGPLGCSGGEKGTPKAENKDVTLRPRPEPTSPGAGGKPARQGGQSNSNTGAQ